MPEAEKLLHSLVHDWPKRVRYVLVFGPIIGVFILAGVLFIGLHYSVDFKNWGVAPREIPVGSPLAALGLEVTLNNHKNSAASQLIRRMTCLTRRAAPHGGCRPPAIILTANFMRWSSSPVALTALMVTLRGLQYPSREVVPISRLAKHWANNCAHWAMP